jgi:hypothetical protein
MSSGERSPLLQRRLSEESDSRTVRPLRNAARQDATDDIQSIRIEDYPDENPRSWQKWRKMANVGVIALMSSMYCRSKMFDALPNFVVPYSP